MERNGFDVSVILTRNEKRLRTWWLWITLLSPLVTIVSWRSHMSEVPADYQFHYSSALVAFFVVICACMWLVIWYCAYKRHGTRWLSYLIWCGAFAYIIIGLTHLANRGLGLPSSFQFIDLFGLISLYMNIRLRKINRKILKHICENESRANQRFLEIHDLGTLKGAYQEEKKLWPQVTRYIRKAYKDRKMELSTGKNRVDITVLTKKEVVIRKFWLYYLMFLPTAIAIIWVISIAVAQFNLLSQQTFIAIGMVTSVLVLQSLPTWILYHCAYKKHKTGYLTLNLCLSLLFPLSFLINLDEIEKFNPFGLLVMFLLWALWVYLCVKLRNINKFLQANQGCNCPEYHHDVTLLNESVSLEDLDNAFHRIIVKWPQWERNASMKYKKKKEELA